MLYFNSREWNREWYKILKCHNGDKLKGVINMCFLEGGLMDFPSFNFY